jgi:hypothetical protein
MKLSLPFTHRILDATELAAFVLFYGIGFHANGVRDFARHRDAVERGNDCARHG